MDQLASAARLVRFGVFELDLRTGEVRKSGVKLRLHGQPVEVLKMLLERPGELVTREELEKRLWVGDTVVEFEHSINAAVNRLREALGDSADNPRFIETLARRGYRFIYPVAPVSPPATGAAMSSSPVGGEDAATSPVEVGAHGVRPDVAAMGTHGMRPDVGADGVRPLDERATTMATRRVRPDVVAMGTRRVPLQKRWRVIALTAASVLAIVAALLALNVAGLRERILRAVAAVSDRRTAMRTSPLQKIESIAVLPLENLSGDPAQEYFADGMTEALISDLGKISALRVISRTSVMRFKGARPAGGLAEIAQKLNVDAVVEGSVMHSGERVRITANLIDARSERHLWAESYDRDVRDVLALQSEVARAIASEVKAKVTPEVLARLASARPVDKQAHEAYLKGRYFWHKRTTEGLEKGIVYFRRAIEKDPSYALAYVGLADSYDILSYQGLLPPTEGVSKAKGAVSKALEINSMLGEAHVAHGDALYRYDWDWPGAERAFKRAIELNPNDFRAHQWYGYYLISMGRVQEALAEAMRGQGIEPLSPIATVAVGWVHFLARDYNRSIEECRRALELYPSFIWAHWCLGRALEQKGMYDEAIAEFQKARLAADIPPVLGALGHAYGVSGRKAEARQVIEQLKNRGIQDYFYPSVLSGKSSNHPM